MSRVILLLMASVMSSCGFHAVDSQPLNNVVIENRSHDLSLTRLAKQQLTLIPSCQQPQKCWHVIIDNAQFHMQTLGVGSNAHTQINRLNYTLSYRLMAPGQAKLSDIKKIVVRRSFTSDSNQILSFNIQRRTLEKELKQAALLKLAQFIKRTHLHENSQR